jgi:aminoglycoside phosphotransferase (APT) family kinase protein
MTEPWAAERVVDPDLASRLIKAQFRDLRPVQLELLGKGWDNTAYLVNNLIVFRFPRRKIAVPLIEIEARVLPRIAPKLPLPVPRPRWVGKPTEEYPWPFLGYSLIAGRTADRSELDDRARSALARPLGEFLRALHAQPSEGVDGDAIGRADPQRLIERIGRALSGGGLLDDASPVMAVAAECAGVPPGTRLVLVHGDLYSRHLLVDDENRLSGVIDWGDLHRGDSALDLSVAWSFLPPRARDAFRKAYGPVEENTWRLARLRALHYGVVLLDYARGTGDAGLGREGLAILNHAIAE